MKNRQLKFALLITSSFLTIGAFAQKDSSGIYKTPEDFQHGKLSYAINYKTENHKINDDLLFDKSDIKVKHMGKSYSMKKSDTYGYRDTKGIDYRFVDNKAYKLLSKKGGVLLYVYQNIKQGTKGPTQYESEYYFSKDIASAPQHLTKENLKTSFPDNHKFHDALDATFKDDTELAAYDSFHKMYKVNHVLEMNSK